MVKESTEKQRHVFMLDMDGSLFIERQLNIDELLKSEENQAIINKIIEAAQSGDPVVLMMGSNRQSVLTDMQNAAIGSTPSAIDFLEKLQEHIKLQVENANVSVDTVLTTDFSHNDVPGTHWQIAKEILKEERPHGRLSKAKAEEKQQLKDESKIAQIIAQAHYLASKYPDESLEITFSDDRIDIHHYIAEFFSKHPDLLPNNVTLNLVHHATVEASKGYEEAQADFNTIQGKLLEAKAELKANGIDPDDPKVKADFIVNKGMVLAKTKKKEEIQNYDLLNNHYQLSEAVTSLRNRGIGFDMPQNTQFTGTGTTNTDPATLYQTLTFLAYCKSTRQPPSIALLNEWRTNKGEAPTADDRLQPLPFGQAFNEIEPLDYQLRKWMPIVERPMLSANRQHFLTKLHNKFQARARDKREYTQKGKGILARSLDALSGRCESRSRTRELQVLMKMQKLVNGEEVSGLTSADRMTISRFPYLQEYQKEIIQELPRAQQYFEVTKTVKVFSIDANGTPNNNCMGPDSDLLVALQDYMDAKVLDRETLDKGDLSDEVSQSKKELHDAKISLAEKLVKYLKAQTNRKNPKLPELTAEERSVGGRIGKLYKQFKKLDCVKEQLKANHNTSDVEPPRNRTYSSPGGGVK